MTSRTFDEIKIDLGPAFISSDAEALLRCSIELDALGTPQAEATASRVRGWALRLQGDYTAALTHCHRALAIYKELGDLSGVAGVVVNIGTLLMDTGDYSQALDQFHYALTLNEELGDRNGQAIVAGNIGNVHQSTGDYPAALSRHHYALGLHQELSDLSGVARVTGNIGIVLSSTGDYPAALEHYHRALSLHEELGNRTAVANIMGSIGLVHADTGDYPAALEHHHRALALHEELGDRSGVAADTSNIGIVFGYNGDYPAALSHFHHALALYEELGERSGVAIATGNILTAYVNMESNVDAQALLQTMDAMSINDPGVRIGRELQRAILQWRSSNLEGADVTLQHALSEALEHGLSSEAAEAHKALRDLALKQNNLAGYVEHNNEYTRIIEEINGKETALKLAMQAKQREIDAVQREHAQHMAVLHSTLPKHIADRVARGETVNDHYDNASVIFLDIVGFTTISDRIPSGHVVYLLEQIFSTLDAVCKRHNVIKIKTIGDSYMAVSFESVSIAASCAFDMLTSLDALQIAMPTELGDTSWTKDIGDLKVRIGVHCGPLTAGVIGTERMQYDVWGDTVNVASRMESTSEPGRIHVSEAFATFLLSTPLGDSAERPLQVTERGTVDVKGKGSMQTYWLA